MSKLMPSPTKPRRWGNVMVMRFGFQSNKAVTDNKQAEAAGLYASSAINSDFYRAETAVLATPPATGFLVDSKAFNDSTSNALHALLTTLQQASYSFTTPTPSTHQRVLDLRSHVPAADLRDVFGWSLPFAPNSVPNLPLDVCAALLSAGLLTAKGEQLVSTVRVSTVNRALYVHSAFPTSQDHAVFLGPDTYRFVRFIEHAVLDWARGQPVKRRPCRILDIGCGTGAGGMAVVRALQATSPGYGYGQPMGQPLEVTMNDINPLALAYTQANMAFAGLPVQLALGDALGAVTGCFDIIVCNPPYMLDTAQRAYRHGGERLGRALSVRIAAQALGRLAPGGQLLLYTGVAMQGDQDPFLNEIKPLLAAAQCGWHYNEIDPDVFGETLEQASYSGVERIAAVGLQAVSRRAGNAALFALI